MRTSRRRSRTAVAGIVSTIVMFAILFSVGTSYFLWVEAQNSAYLQTLVGATHRQQNDAREGLSVTAQLETDGDVGFYVADTSVLAVNVTGALVLSSSGTLLRCDGIGFPAGSGCGNSTPTLWVEVNPGAQSPSIDTGYVYVSGTTDTVKVITARGNSYSASYPTSTTQSTSSQSVTVTLDNLRWVQLLPQASSLVQKKFVSNCNAAACAATYGSSVTSGNILVDAVSWPSTSPPSSAPSDSLHDSFTLGASASANVQSSAAVVQSRYTSNCNAASCGLAFSSNVGAGHTLVYAVGWANQNAPSTPTDTLGDTFTLGASKSVTYTPPSPALVQSRYNANCNSATCSLAYSSSVTAGNTLVLGLGWSGSAASTSYVPITVNNCPPVTIALDGHNYSDSGSPTTTITASLTTANAGDVIIAIVTGQSGTGTYQTPTASDSAGLTWSARSTLEKVSSAGGFSYYGQIFYAIAPAALSSDTITMTWGAAPSSYDTLQVFGVSGANTSFPFDGHSGLPAFATGADASVTTSNANDFVYGAELADNTASPTAGSGFTGIESGISSSWLASEYKVVSSTQSGLSLTFSDAGSDADGAWGDAIQQASCGSTATATPFQLMVTWNPSTYSTYEASNLGNIRFCADALCATPLYAWLESCTSSCGTSATSATAWVKLTSAIAGGGSTTIYMVFEPTTTNFDGNYWGEAPSLSATYAQYDNGANVFLAYANGNTATSSFTVASGYTLTQATGVTFGSGTINALESTGSGTFGNIAWALNTNIPNQGLVEEGIMQHTDTGNDVMTLALTDSTTSSNNAIGEYNYYGGSYFAQEYSVGGTKTSDQNQQGTGTQSWVYFTVTYPGSTSTTYSGYIAPQFYSSTGGYTGTVTANPFGSSTNLHIADAFGNQNSTPNNYYFDLVRARAYPPGGTMPSVTFGSVSGTSYSYVAITITNNQSTATPNPFQLMVTWNPSTYSSYEASNLGNIRFCADTLCATPLYGWLESCSSTCSTSGSSSTSATAWVKLTSAIAASGGQLTIYMVFEPTSTNFDGNYWGEAPQLSGTYAQYDNGANVFTAYFDGNTATSNFALNTNMAVSRSTGITGPGGTTINAIHFSGYAGSGAEFEFSATLSNAGTIVEGSFADVNTGTATGVLGLMDNAAPGSVQNGINAGDGFGTDFFSNAYYVAGAQTNSNNQGTASTAWEYGSVTYSGTSATSWSAYIAPQLYSTTGGYSGTVSDNPLSAATHIYMGGGFGSSNGGYTVSVNLNFMRARAYPPSGTMPSVSLGSVTSSGSGNSSPTISDTLGDTFTLGSSASVGGLYYLPITLTNSQTSATASTFQQMVTWNPSTYSTYEATNLGNIRFCTTSSCATELYAWLESCSSTCSTSGSSSTSATAWVKLTSAIAASGGTQTIYMVFQSTGTTFDGNYWGEAPQLSSTYGQYDNGANVFSYYVDFSGSSLPASLTTYASSGTDTVNNGLTLSAGSGQYIHVYTSGTSSPGVLEAYLQSITSSSELALAYDTTGPSSGGDYGFQTAYRAQDAPTYGNLNMIKDVTGTGTALGTATPTISSGVLGLEWPATGIENLYAAYTKEISATDSAITYGSSKLDMFFYGTAASQSAVVYWLRNRVDPPSQVMPSVSFGSVSETSSTVYYSNIWYATAGSSGSNTITATFSSTVAGTVSIYELTGYNSGSTMSSSGGSGAGSTAASVTSFTPAASSFVIGNVETASSSTEYTVGSGYTTIQSGANGCDATHASEGCNEYESGLGSATTVPWTLSASTVWVEAAISFAPLSSSTYYSYVWYATTTGSGPDTIAASFSQSVAGSVSIYELSGVTTAGLLSSTGSSSSSQSSSSVTSMTPSSGSVVIGNTETSSTTFTAGSGYTLAGTCTSVLGCSEYQTGVGSATTVPMSFSTSVPWAESAVAFAPTTTPYYSYIWYATATTSGADTVTTTFGSTTQGSVSLYEITGYTLSGALSSTGSSPTGSTTASVTSFTPSSDSFIVGAAEASTSDTYTAGSGFTLVGTCSSVQGCSQYDAGGGGAANTVPITLSTSEPWVEAAMSFSTPFNEQSGIQVGGYPTMGVPSGASLVWEVTFTDVDPLQRSISVWPQSLLTIGSAEYDGFDTDFTEAHYFIISSLNPGSTTVNPYSATSFVTLQYNVPTTLYFASTQALGSTTQAFGTNVLTPFEAYFALTGVMSDGTLFGETIPYPYGVITEANAYTTTTQGAPGAQVTVSCTSPCDFNDNYKALVGWINAAGQFTQMTTFTMSASGNIPSGVTFNVPNTATVGDYYTICVTDYVNTVFMTYYVT